ncbi:unnamed protein product [Hymenolepis diminuta]|uniref:Nondiscriminating glutamyl-tRNA synthetase EARS2, mitochondrial n=1 Tax=Hymenolepis diminuta TaxID=6216 RepID=A0A564Y416_HYMDI|nr:unnamed protein product [Hymenolepis diminuta]
MNRKLVLYQIIRYCSTIKRRTRTRFAPSPTGPLHIGGLRTALINYILARRDGGDFILRIEDTDQSRCSVDAFDGIIEGLKWAGLKPDEGPSFGGKFGPYIQSERLGIYHKYADHLLQTGRAYRCFCSRERLEILKNEQRRRGETVRYDNRCRHVSHKELHSNFSQDLPYVIRFKLIPGDTVFYDAVYGDISFPNVDSEGDPVIIKSDGLPVYHLANVIDDHLMEISHVIRGSEWITSVPKHLQIYSAFDWEPPIFAHLPLMLSSSGRKFSKRDKEQASVALVENLRREGHLPSALLTWLAATGGLFEFAPSNGDGNSNEGEFTGLWRPENRIEELLSSFDFHSLTRHHARVDPELLQLCGRAHFDRLINEASSEQSTTHSAITEYLRDYLNKFHQTDGDCDDLKELLNDERYFIQMLMRLKGRINRISDLTSVSSEISFIWHPPNPESIRSSLSPFDTIGQSLFTVASELESLEKPSEDEIKAIFRSSGKLSGLPKAKFLKKLRVCLTGSEHGMPVHELILLLTPKEAAKRIRSAVKVFS